jgi:uncharacterized membrane protein YqaE (UPF0057 family)
MANPGKNNNIDYVPASYDIPHGKFQRTLQGFHYVSGGISFGWIFWVTFIVTLIGFFPALIIHIAYAIYVIKRGKIEVTIEDNFIIVNKKKMILEDFRDFYIGQTHTERKTGHQTEAIYYHYGHDSFKCSGHFPVPNGQQVINALNSKIAAHKGSARVDEVNTVHQEQASGRPSGF